MIFVLNNSHDATESHHMSAKTTRQAIQLQQKYLDSRYQRAKEQGHCLGHLVRRLQKFKIAFNIESTISENERYIFFAISLELICGFCGTSDRRQVSYTAENYQLEEGINGGVI
jgi:hypothetical protein